MMARTLGRTALSSATHCPFLPTPEAPLLLCHGRLHHHPSLSPLRPALFLYRNRLLPSLYSVFSTRFCCIRCRVSRSGGPAYSPLSANCSNCGDRPPAEMAPLFPGCDYNHWLIVMDKPGGEGAIKQQMIDCFVQTLAKVLGSEEEAKKKIYNVACERYFGFGCEIDEETSNQLEAELFVNGEIVQRSPERQRKVDPVPPRTRDRPKYNDRTRYVRRRENMG